uniref:PHD-type domain-containing protein n=1 Tax=Anopheles atroparvus TaxID=41427 RepID=A0AAG5CR98_ANOAO
MAGAPVSCGNDPNFGIILSFMEQFGPVLDIGELNIAELQSMLENSETVPQALADLHIKLMRKINKKVPAARWELALAKFAHSYSHQDAWEIERFGYKTANLAVKLRVLKALLEGQFDLNTKFKTQINTTGAGELRLDPLGRDRQGNCYWYFMDESANVQIYQSDPEMEAWTLVARNRDEFVNMIEMLKDNRPIEPLPAGNAVDEEDESAGSASDAEAMKLGTILAPSETPPSLIISRRTYKTCDKMNAPAAAEDEANAGEDSERSNSAAVEDDDVEMNSNAPPVASEPGDEKKNDISVEKGNEAEPVTKAIKPEDTTTDAAPAECEVKTDDGVNEAMQCELDSKDEEMSTKGEPTEGEQAEESAAIDKCIKKEEPVTEVEATKSEASAKEKEESHGEAESERVENSGGEKETEEQRDAKEAEANGTAQPDPEKPVEVPQASHEESLPVETREKKEEEIVDKPDTEPAAEPAVGEAIEDPPVVVRGAGSGAECDSGIVPMFSEVIEEPIMFFYGAGAGVENGMGNTKKVEPALTAPESTTVNEAKPVGTKERVPSTDNAPVTSKAGNGERKPSPKGKPVKDGSSRSASKGPLVHSDGEEHANSECNEKKPLEETECTDNGGADHADPPSKGGELSAKDNDTMELGDRAVDDGCDGGNEDHEAAEVEPSQKKRTRKAPPEKPQKVTLAPRGKRSEKTPVETAMPAVAELVQEKPMEKKRGSRKSSTPKKALDSITATAILTQGSQEVKSEEQLKMESEEKPQPGARVDPAEDIKPSSAEQEPNGDHLQQPQSSCAEDNSNGVKKEERKEVIVKEEGIADCKKESKSDLNKLTELADPGEVKGGTAMVAAASKDITEETTDAIAAEKTPIKEEKKEELEKSLDGGASDKGGVPQSEGESPAKRKRRQRNGLVDGLDISMVLDAGSDGGNNPPVRQSRRIAMQKIKEETNRRQIEDEMLKKMKADAVKKKKDLGMHISDDEYRRTESTPDQSDSSSSGGGMGGDGRRRKKKKKKKKGSYQQQLLQQQQLAAQLLKKQTTWNSATSPESSSETEAEDYFAEPYHSEEDVRRSNVLKSDHEFSPESDLESEAPAQPLKRARTARKARRTRDVEAEEEEEDEEESDGGEDHACQECKKTDQPEWILLCDSCDKGYHCACLKPVLFTIPEGDWFCPVCQHRQLIERLQSKLELYDALQAKLVAEAKRREEEEQCAREAELAEQALEREREEQLRAQKRARQQQRLLERADSGRGRGGAGGNGRRSSRSRSASLDSSREEHQRQRRRRKQRQRNRKASKRRRSSRSRSGDGSGSGATGGSDDGSGGSGSGGSGSGGSGSCTDSDDIPIYKHLRRRASTKVSYKFNEYDNLIDSAIRREMRGCEMMEVEPDEEEDVDDEEGHGFSKGKDISTIIEATTREEQARKKAAAASSAELDANEEGGGLDKDAIAEHDVDRRLNGSSQVRGENVGDDAVASPTGEEGKKSGGVRQDRAKATIASKKARKKKKKLCKIELSSEEEEDDSDEDFRGDVSGSDDEEEEDDDEEDEDENSMSGDSESSLEVGRRGRNAERSRKPSSRAAVSKRRRIVENSDDSEDEAEERRREIAKKNRKNRRVLDDSDEDLDLDDDDDEEDSEDYDSDDLCSDTETESSRSSDNSSNSSSSSSSSASTEGDWRRKKKKKTKGTGGGGKTKSKSAPSGGGGGGGLGSGKHIERPPKKPSTATGRPKAMDSSGEDSGDSDSAGKGGKTMPRKPSKKSASRSSRSPESGKGGEKKSDRKTRGKKIHYIVDDDFESSDDGIRPGVQRPDTPPEEREQFIRRQEEIKRMLAENNAAKAKELATSKIDQLVGGGRAGAGSAKESAKDSLSDVPMQVIESARILDIDFLKSTSGNTARISTVDSVVDFDDELPEDFDPDDEMDDEALAKIMEEEDFAHHQLKAPVGVSASIAAAADLLPPVPGPPPMKANRRKSIPDPGELLLPQQRAGRPTTDPPAASQTRKDLQHHHASPLPVNLVSSASSLPPPHVQSPMKALLKPTGIPTSTIMPPMVSTGGGGGGGTILANALQTTAAPHGHHAPMVPPPPLVKELPHPGASRADVLMRSLAGPPPPGGSLHHKPSDLSHLMAGLAGSGIALPLAKGGGAPLSLPPPPHTHHSSHRMPPVGLGMPPNMLGHGPPPHAPHLGLHTKLPPGVPPGAGHGSNVPHSAAAVAAAVAAASAAAAAAIGAGGASGPASAGPVPSSGIPHTTPTTGNPSTPTLAVGTSPHPVVAASAAERRPGRRKKITPLREDLKRRGNAAAGPPPSGEQQPSAVPSAAHQEQHQRLPPQHASQHHGHMVRLPAGPPPPPTSTAAPPVGLRPPIPPATSIHSTAHQNATAMAAAAAAAAAAQELAIKVHSRSGDGGGAGVGGPGMLVNEPPLSVPSSVAHLSYFRSENPLFAHRLGPLPSSILSSGSSSLQRIAAISGAAGPQAVYGDPTAYNGGWKPPPSGSSSKMKSTGSTQPPPPPTHPGGMMVGPPSIGSLEHYHEYNPANHYNPYYNVLDRAHLRPPPTIGELHRTSALSPTTFTTLQPLEFQHVMKPTGDNHHHHHSATSSPASTAGEDVGGGGSVGGGGRGSASSVERLAVPSHGGGPPPSSSAPASSETHPSVVEAASPPPSASVAVSVAPSTLVPPSAVSAVASTTASTTSSSSTSVFGELVSYFSSQQDDLDS